jgi:hypothetical protein
VTWVATTSISPECRSRNSDIRTEALGLRLPDGSSDLDSWGPSGRAGSPTPLCGEESTGRWAIAPGAPPTCPVEVQVLTSILAVAAVILTPVLVAFLAWLGYCLIIDKRHSGSPEKAALVIEATGRWFPMRLRSALRMDQMTKPAPLPGERAGEETN